MSENLKVHDKLIQHNLVKLTSVERIKLLFDEDSFVELEGLVANKSSGVIIGYGTVNGRLVYAYSIDGGAINKINSKKICNIIDMAVKMGAPLVQIYESIGGELSEDLNIFNCYGDIINRNAKLSGVIPQMSIICGTCTGLLALSAAISDFTVMVSGQAEVYINEPEDIIKNEGKYVDIDMYGYSKHCANIGNAQIIAQDEKEGIAITREILSYLPSNNIELPYKDSDIIESLDLINDENGQYSLEKILGHLCDKESIIEVNKDLSQGMKTFIGKINGSVVGIVGNSENNNKLTIKDFNKITKLIKICDCFNISIISLVNCEGFMESLEEETGGILLEGAKTLALISQATIPKISLIYGSCYGAIYTMLAGKGSSFDIVYAWPSSRICVTRPEKLLKIIYREDILASEIPSKKEEEIIKGNIDNITSPHKAADEGYVDDIILPNETRNKISNALEMLQSKRELSYPKKHGSVLI
ncbi:carboxyl transferase domain-containing protein [Clostridium lundense]|uniref:carboxyl transferase domain-containing protein n=1 Tax=Clostridium lundense TaxID=319475 RepID=UPI0006869C6D|nr:carboxyl transferase domain-containing protein [Clostridium lundense]